MTKGSKTWIGSVYKLEKVGTRSLEIFTAFSFLNASGNAMVIFSDGQDSQVVAKGKTLAQILASAVEARIPVYLIRTSRGKAEGEIVPDAIWRPAVEATGGRFWTAESLDRLRQTFAAIAEAMGHRYLLRFEPDTGRKPGWHRLEL